MTEANTTTIQEQSQKTFYEVIDGLAYSDYKKGSLIKLTEQRAAEGISNGYIKRVDFEAKARERIEFLKSLQPEFEIALTNPATGNPSTRGPISKQAMPETIAKLHRPQLNCELKIELDLATTAENINFYKEIVKPKLLEANIANFDAWATNSKSIDVSLFFDRPISNGERLALIDSIFTQEEKNAFDSAYWKDGNTPDARPHLSSMEWSVHYKSGLPKTLFEKVGDGLNKFPENLKVKERESFKPVLKPTNPNQQCPVLLHLCKNRVDALNGKRNSIDAPNLMGIYPEKAKEFAETQGMSITDIEGWKDTIFNCDQMQKRAKEVNLENICQNCKKGIAASFFTGKYNNKFVPKRLGDRILETFYIKTLERNDRMYVFEGGYYKEKGKDLIKKACVELLDERYHHGHFSETVSYIQGSTYTNPDEIDNGWINLKNGLLNPFTLESRKHSPEVFSTMQLPIEYDPNADCPTWKEKLKEKTDGPTQDILQKMFGYTFMPGQKYQVAFLLHGPKRTMKSTVINVLESVVGKENATSMSLQYLTEDKYAAAYLYGKPLNVCSDLSAMALRDTGKFMLITGGDKITAGKKHEHQVDFHPSTKLIFSCNEIPPTANKNPAFYRRWIILTFNKQTHESDIDTSLSEKFEEELPGILNWALTGLEKLIKDDSFNYWLDPEEVKDLYEKNSDSIQSFIFNKIDSENDEGVMKKRVVYKAYKQYCQDEGLRTENQIKFGKMFIQLTGCGNCQENKIPAYRGVEWREGRQPTLSEY